jgi:hypothetical protein
MGISVHYEDWVIAVIGKQFPFKMAARLKQILQMTNAPMARLPGSDGPKY